MAIENDVLINYAVYDHPRDFPDDYVVRRWFVKRGLSEPVPERSIYMQSENLLDIRTRMKELGLTRINRQEGDDATILETWL